MKRPSLHSEVGRTEESSFSGLHLLLVKRGWHKADYFIISQAWGEKWDRNLAAGLGQHYQTHLHARKPATISSVLSAFKTKVLFH